MRVSNRVLKRNVTRILRRFCTRITDTFEDKVKIETTLQSEPDQHSGWCHRFSPPKPEYDWQNLLDKRKVDVIKENISLRKAQGNIDKLHALYSKYSEETGLAVKEQIWKEMQKEAALLPNISHPLSPVGGEDAAKVIGTIGSKREFNFNIQDAVSIGEKLNLLRTKHLKLTSGHRSYYFMNDLVTMENALIQYALKRLDKEDFSFVSVPDILHPSIVEACGFPTGEISQVYRLDPRHGEACLSGTSEMALAGMLVNETRQLKDLPLKFAAVSRCYRAEVSRLEHEKGLYRVHNFTKVEMFGVTANERGNESDALHNKFLDIQTNLYRDLGLHFRILDMPTEELGSAAYRKFDIEAWMPDKQFWGEISSTSNCTDYQSRRLAIKYSPEDGDSSNAKFVHTVNGTACAIPRMVMAILENYQHEDGTVTVPAVLLPYMNGIERLRRRDVGKMTWKERLATQKGYI